MAANTLTGQNIEFPIYKADGSSFCGLVLRKTTFDSVVMSLGDKITGDVVYENNELPVSMNEYIEFGGVKYTLVNPPTVVREGFAKDNSDLKGMTRYSFEFYHPMYQLGNLPFSDVAVSSDEQRYLSENKVFNWIGKPDDYIAKLNKNLENTQWVVIKSVYFPIEKLDVLSEVLSFDKATIADALKTWYDTWKVPFIVDIIKETDPLYAQGKRFCVIVGFPAEEILDTNGNPYIFKMGQGVGLKNNSRTPKNNKIVTRIAPYGSERNIPYGYPQIVWTGNQDWEYTIDNNPAAENSYPIYDGIVGGQNVRLIKHPFTRKTLMPSIYATLVNEKVNPNAIGYDPTIELVDYYDATSEEGYPNPINPLVPSYEAHEFGDIYPRLDEKSILSAEPYDTLEEQGIAGYVIETEFLGTVLNNSTSTKSSQERAALLGLYNALNSGLATYHAESQSGDDYQFVCDVTSDDDFYYVKYTSSNINYDTVLLKTGHTVPVASSWNDKMDDDGNYVQSYFKITLPLLNFDMYACASITEEMKIYMRSGACIGCTFNVAVDWDDYKRNFYDENGNFAPNGSQRDLTKYPKTNNESVTLIVQKDNETFGTLMPNIYQQPKSGDKFVVLGISLPTSYIADAEQELDDAAKQYMLENNVYYYEYPLKFDEYFLAKNAYILNQIKPNSIVRFKYNGEQNNIVLYVKQITIKYGQGVLPQYDITITDDIEVVLNKIGQVTDDVSRLRLDLSQLMQYYNGDTSASEELQLLLAGKLSKVSDDTAQGFIKFLQGLQVGERFVSGILGEGGVFRRNADGKVYLETDNIYVRMKAYFDTVEVRHYKHSSGNRIASNAGIHCSMVSWIDASENQTEDINNAVKFRCFFRATDGDDTVENYFIAASDGSQDLAFCDKTSLNSGISKRRYWRAVVGKNAVLTDDGEAWIDLSKSDCESGSDIPMAGDDIIQLGNRTDSERQGAIIEYVNGNDAPSYHIYQYINSFDLSGKNIIRIGFNSRTGRAEMNVYGDAYIGDPNGSTYIKYNQATKKVEINAEVNIGSTFGGQTLDEYIQDHTWTQQQIESLFTDDFDDIETAIENIQKQVDGAIETWFYNGAPSSSVLPESEWKAKDIAAGNNNERLKHLGDLYYDNQSGYAYRYTNQGTESVPQFVWTQISDSAVIKALADAAKAQDTADHKRRVFVRQPLASEAYDVGDLWVNATYSGDGVSYANDVLRCNTAKAENVAFSITHWEKASKYTDDTRVNDFITNTYAPFVTNIQGQVDVKAETWRQATNPASAWTTDADKIKHIGDLWMDISANGGKNTYIYVDKGSSANPRYDWEAQDVPQAVFDDIDGKSTIFANAVNTPPSDYKKGDMWILPSDATINGVAYKIGDVLNASQDSTTYNAAHWSKKVRYTDDTALNNFVNNTYNSFVSDIQSQVDGKAETWYQATDPSTNWTSTDLKNQHKGDIWHNTSSTTIAGVESGRDAIWNGTEWKMSDVPQSVYDTIDGKADIFVSKPTTYNINDLWIIEATIADEDLPSGCVKGDIVISSTKRTNSYNKADWRKKDRYTDDSALDTFKLDQYVQQLVNGTINQNISNAQGAANAAQQAAAAAQADADAAQADAAAAATAAANAQTSATNANNRLNGWADDGKISPTEKTSLKLEWENVKKEYTQICNDADKYGVSKTDFASAYTSANSAFQKYTATTPENITIGTDYANIAAYYAARQTILDAITTAAKKVATDAQAKADSAYTLAGSAQTAADNAANAAAALGYLSQALGQDTTIAGGLVLSTLIGLRDKNNKIWSGINGAYQQSETGAGYKGHGIAAWYGGAMVDKEVSTTATDYAKSLFRFDGSGYLAGGNISWDASGNSEFNGKVEVASTRGKWVMEPDTAAGAVPRISGQNGRGNEKVVIFFDADDFDSTYVRDGGGMMFIDISEIDGSLNSRFCRNAWRTNCSGYGEEDQNTHKKRETYISSLAEHSNPRLHFYDNYNGSVHSLTVGLNLNGAFLSGDWLSKSQATANGMTYVDDWGNLKVKRSSGYEQYNFVYGQSGSEINVIKLPKNTPSNPIPDGTMYFVKGNGSSWLGCESPIMNSHNSSYWPLASGYYSNMIYGQSHIFLMQTVNGTKVWIDFYASAQDSPD